MINRTRKLKSGRLVYICHFRGVDFVSLAGRSAAMNVTYRVWTWERRQ